MDLSKCGGICRSDCKHYGIGVECPSETTYEAREICKFCKQPLILDHCNTGTDHHRTCGLAYVAAIGDVVGLIDGGSFLHDQSPSRLFANEVIKAIKIKFELEELAAECEHEITPSNFASMPYSCKKCGRVFKTEIG